MTQRRVSPTVPRRRVGTQLRRWREAAGLKPGDAAKAIGWGAPRLSRTERGVYTINREGVAHLAGIYGVTDQEAIAEVGRAAEIPPGTGWWTPYAGLITPHYLDFVELEAESRTIRVQHPVLVPGLLQSPGYAREIISHTAGGISKDRIEMLVSVRMARQSVLTRSQDPVQLHAVLPESALHVNFESGPEVMRDQLRKLLDAANYPNTKIQIVPLTAHPAHGSNVSTTIFTYHHPWSAVASIENPMGGTHTEDDEKVSHLEVMFEHLTSVALPVEQTRELLHEYMERHHK